MFILICFIGVFIYFSSCESCNSNGTSGSSPGNNEGDPVIEEEIIQEQDPKPCPFDPLVTMELAIPGDSGKPGALFGCRRYGSACDLTIGSMPKRHRGIDLLAEIGTSVYCMHDGVVHDTWTNKGCTTHHGNRIIVKSIVNGVEYLFFYCHLSEVSVNIGDTVQREQIIGKTGDSGNACDITNKHLHVEVQRNGYYDPEDFMTTQFDESGNKVQTCSE